MTGIGLAGTDGRSLHRQPLPLSFSLHSIKSCCVRAVLFPPSGEGLAGASTKWMQRRPSFPFSVDVTEPVNELANHILHILKGVAAGAADHRRWHAWR